jgi:hypothetical protein
MDEEMKLQVFVISFCSKVICMGKRRNFHRRCQHMDVCCKIRLSSNMDMTKVC